MKAESILPDSEVVRAGRQQGLAERRKLQEEQARRSDFKQELTPRLLCLGAPVALPALWRRIMGTFL